MSIRRFSSRTHRLDTSFLMQHLTGARSYKRIAGYFTSSLFEVAGEALQHIPEVKIVCNVDIHPDDLKVAQLRESKMLGRWNERGLEAEALLNRERYRRLDAFLAKHGQAVRFHRRPNRQAYAQRAKCGGNCARKATAFPAYPPTPPSLPG